jgi:hypothetical protein
MVEPLMRIIWLSFAMSSSLDSDILHVVPRLTHLILSLHTIQLQLVVEKGVLSKSSLERIDRLCELGLHTKLDQYVPEDF